MEKLLEVTVKKQMQETAPDPLQTGAEQAERNAIGSS